MSIITPLAITIHIRYYEAMSLCFVNCLVMLAVEKSMIYKIEITLFNTYVNFSRETSLLFVKIMRCDTLYTYVYSNKNTNQSNRKLLCKILKNATARYCYFQFPVLSSSRSTCFEFRNLQNVKVPEKHLKCGVFWIQDVRMTN